MNMTRTIMRGRAAGEQGMALIAVILMLMVMSALCAALAVSGNTETLIARNHQTAAEARAAAEAGLNHAVDLIIDNLEDWESNFATLSLAMTALLADGGSLEDFGISASGEPLGDLPDVTYGARVLDEDDPERGLEAADILRIGEPLGDEDTDQNMRIVVQATGTASGNTKATVEATIAPLELPAILTDGDLEIAGNFTLAGTQGGVHTNSDLDFSGAAASITGDCTASGDTDGSPTVGSCSDGEPTITVPTARANDYLSKADYILHDDGMIETVGSTTVACANPCAGAWRWSAGDSEWQITPAGNLTPSNGTYYVETSVDISGSPGSLATPAQMSIIAVGSIEIHTGSPYVTPDSAGLLFVTDEDLRITGNLTANYAEAQILVRGQLELAGNSSLAGQMLVQDVAVGSLVAENSISGTVTLTYNGSLDDKFFTVSAWRRVTQ